MSARLQVVPAEGALSALSHEVHAAQGDDPLARVCVVVERRRSAPQLRRLLADSLRRDGRAGIAGVHVGTLSDVADEWGGAALAVSGLQPLSRTVLGGAVRASLRHDAGSLRSVANHPTTEDEIVATYEDLRWAGPEALEQVSRCGGRAAEIARLCLDIRARLVGSFFDDVDLLEAAAAAVRKEPTAPAHLVWHLPERVRPAELALLAALASRGEVTVILGAVSDVVADRPMCRLGRRLLAAGFASASPLPPASEDPLVASSPLSFSALIEANDPQTAASAAVRTVLGAVEAGADPARCAIVVPRPGPGLDALRRACEATVLPGTGRDAACGLSIDGPASRRLSSLPAARVLQGLLGLCSSAEVGRRELIGWYCGAPVRSRAGGRPPLEEWDRCSRRAGIVLLTPNRWQSRLAEFVADSGAAGDDESAAAGASLAEELADLEGARQTVRALASWAAFASWARTALERYLWHGGADADPEGSESAVGGALSELALLDGVEPSPDLERFAAAFARATARRAPVLRRRGVLVGTLEDVHGGEFDLVCIVGCEEGELPARTATARLLDGASRAAAGLEAPDAFATVVRDRRRLALCRAAAATCVGVIVAHDDSGRARSASRFVDPAAPRVRLGALPGAPLPPELAAAAFVSAEERAWVLLADAEEAAADRLFGELGLARGATAARERGLRRFGAYSGEITEGDLAGVLSDRILSPTRLEAYAVCPFRFFATSLLACDVLEEPEARLSIDARDRGTLVHEVLQRFVAGQIAAPEDPNAASAERLRELADEVCERYRRLGRTGKDVLWAAERRRILEWLERERVSDAERRAGGARPLAVEHRFGTSPADALVRVVGGVQMRFRGAIDRVDAEPGGGLRVIDYKTGRGAGYRAIADDPLGRGRFLQLPLYALAARQAFGATAATAAYRLVGDEPGEVAVHLGPETEERLDTVLATLVGAIRNGMFPHRPGPRRRGVHENCEYCDFDALCPSERAGLWEGARAEEALSGYVALVEGADMAGGDDER